MFPINLRMALIFQQEIGLNIRTVGNLSISEVSLSKLEKFQHKNAFQ